MKTLRNKIIAAAARDNPAVAAHRAGGVWAVNARLYAPAAYWQLSAAGRAELELNGCGPDGWKNRLVPEKLLGVSITAACDIHDYMYIVGETEAHREEADRVFLNNMLRIVEAESANWLTRTLRRRLALHYYEAVRDLGGPYFWEEKNPPETFRNLQEVAAWK